MFLTALLLCALPHAQDPSTWRDRGEERPVAIWDRLENKIFPSLDGLTGWHNTDPLSLEDLRGNVVLVQHVAMSRKPAVRAIPPAVGLWLDHQHEGLVVLTICAKRDAADFQRFLVKNGVPHAVAVDSTSRLTRQVGAKKAPTYHVLDREGVVRVAGANGDMEVLEEIVTAVLAEPWEGERRQVQYAARRWTDPRPKPAPPLVVGAGGWPAQQEKGLYARHDFRGLPAPDFRVTHWLTQPVVPDGRPFLQYLWATYSPTVLAGLDQAQALHERFGEQLLVLCLSEQAPDASRRGDKHPWNTVVEDLLLQSPEITHSHALDGTASVKTTLGVQGLPHALLIDSRGIVRWQGDPLSSDHPLSEAVVERFLQVDILSHGRPSLLLVADAFALSGASPSLPGVLYLLGDRPPLFGSSAVAGWTQRTRALGEPILTVGAGRATGELA
ncbi:MAG: redoxin domain-containing protein, partial [Planctomycetota bacterium]|nr:redoxin domain-containing protein [Planctomycetota bacterium]